MTPQDRRQQREEEYQTRKAALVEAHEKAAFGALQDAVQEAEQAAQALQKALKGLRRAERAVPRTKDRSRQGLQRRARELSGILRRVSE